MNVARAATSLEAQRDAHWGRRRDVGWSGGPRREAIWMHRLRACYPL